MSIYENSPELRAEADRALRIVAGGASSLDAAVEALGVGEHTVAALAQLLRQALGELDTCLAPAGTVHLVDAWLEHATGELRLVMGLPR